MTALPDGYRLDSYRLTAVVGTGAFGIVYAAEDQALGQQVALKEYFPRDIARRADDGMTVAPRDAAEQGSFRAGLDAFFREAKALARVKHPGVLRVSRLMEANGTAYMVTELVAGKTVAERLREGDSIADEAALRALLLPLLEALEQVHGTGLLHRDIKPANIRIRLDGSPVLVDFGSVGEMGVPSGDRDSLLTPGYAAPEQYGPEAAEGAWTDLYGLAAVAYRIVTGEAPIPAPQRRDRDTLPPAAERAGPGFGTALCAAIDAGLALDPTQRPRTASDWRAQLLRTGTTAMVAVTSGQPGSGPTPAMPVDDDPPTERITRPAARRMAPTLRDARAPQRKRWKIPASVGVVSVLAIAGFLGFVLYETTGPETLVVDPGGGGDATTIGAAIGQASPGDTIAVMPGLYPESLVLDRAVTLRGSARGDVVVQPEAGTCLSVRSDATVIQAMTFSRVVEAGLGPCLELLAGTTEVTDIAVQSATGPALRVAATAGPIVTSSSLSAANAAGVLIEDSATPVLTQNLISGSGRAGILVRGTAAPQIDGNRITRSGQAGILVLGEAGGSISRNEIAETTLSAIELREATTVAVLDNRISDSKQSGIYLHGAARGTVQGNDISGSAYSGIVVGPGTAAAILQNTVRDGQDHGVLLMDNAGGSLAENTITGNRGHGIARSARAATEIGENTLADNRDPQLQTGTVQAEGGGRSR